MGNVLLKIKDLKVDYELRAILLDKSKRIQVINGLSLDIYKGEIVSIAGESGCGKSTLAKSIMRLIDSNDGEIIYDGCNILNSKNLYDYRRKVQIVFQNPYASLNPKMKIKDILREPFEIYKGKSKDEIDEIIEKTISKVNLDTACLNQYPHEFSGGQRQRIAIARALILNPEFIVADEPVSALDVSIQAQIINLLKELKAEYNLTLLFISHDLSVIKYISDRVAIMYMGDIVEIGLTHDIFNNPAHPYTKALLNAAPKLFKQSDKSDILLGDLPTSSELSNGCKFCSRCPNCMQICKENTPNEQQLSDSHKVSCFLYQNI